MHAQWYHVSPSRRPFAMEPRTLLAPNWGRSDVRRAMVFHLASHFRFYALRGDCCATAVMPLHMELTVADKWFFWLCPA